MCDFKDLGLSSEILNALEKKGFTKPTPIQAETIPLLLSGEKDIIGQAQTGTGKTAAFGLPILDRVVENAGFVQALILAPTRELALQVAEEIRSLRGRKRLNIVTVYGGQSYDPQLRALRQGADIIVGTPGRVIDHLSRGTINLDGLSFFVLDEADEMVNMGFIDDVRSIFERAGDGRRTLLFSATMPRQIQHIAEEFMGDYEKVSVKAQKQEAPLTRQIFHEMSESDRFEALCRVIDVQPDFYGLVFCRTKSDTDYVASRLSERGYPAEPIHGDLSQARREQILNNFRRRRTNILVATDVAARGIDVPDLSHVVNYALPMTPEIYTHRVGRTGRAGKEGIAVTLIAPGEFRKLMFMARTNGFYIDKEALPGVDQVLGARRARVANRLDEIVENKRHEAYLPMAEELLENMTPEQAIATALRLACGRELDPAAYRDIREPRRNDNNRVNLRAAVGRAHGMSPRKFVDFISRRTRLKPFKVQHVKVFGKYTTFSVPEGDLRSVVNVLNDRKQGPPFVKTV